MPPLNAADGEAWYEVLDVKMMPPFNGLKVKNYKFFDTNHGYKLADSWKIQKACLWGLYMFYCSISNLHLSFLLGDGFTIDLVQAEHAYSVNIWALQATTKSNTWKIV